MHFPFCQHKCNYCDFYKKVPRMESEKRDFEDFLNDSWEKHMGLMKKYGYQWGELETIYLGGGTPSLWGADGAVFLRSFLRQWKVRLAQKCEFTMEVNPGSLSAKDLCQWRETGVNRFSLGIQSLDNFFLKVLDRVHSLKEVYQGLELFAEEGVRFSVDFMLGLPFSQERERNVLQELETVLKYSPSHISVYILTLAKGHPLFKSLADEAWVEREYLEVSDYLKKCGYFHYEVSNFSKFGEQSKHNLKYWKCGTVAALGPSGAGLLAERRLRYKWRTGVPDYDLERLTDESFRLERFYMALRVGEGLRWGDFFGQDVADQVRLVLEDWAERKLGILEEGIFRLTSKGFLQMDGLLGQLFQKRIL